MWISIHCLLNVQWQSIKNHPFIFERRQWQHAENHIHCLAKYQWHHLWNSIDCLLNMERQCNKNYIHCFLQETGENMWKITSTAKWNSSDNIWKTIHCLLNVWWKIKKTISIFLWKRVVTKYGKLHPLLSETAVTTYWNPSTAY